MPSVAVIVPCFNEAHRLEAGEFIRFAQTHTDVSLFFVNDGSTDATGIVLQRLKTDLQNRVQVITLPTNKGKGEAVRRGMLAALQHNFGYTGYLDADLSTPPEEYYRIYQEGLQKQADIILASRIKKIDSRIQRSAVRHITGRMIATLIDFKFRLGYYDTQCGAKIFKTPVLENIISKGFHTKWFFDVEIFLRIRNGNPAYKAVEIPTEIWLNKKGSKINLLSFPVVMKELFTLMARY